MVRAILDGRKVQTRRVVKLDSETYPYVTDTGIAQHPWTPEAIKREVRCPYGVPGDRLYVKEATWIWCERQPNGTTKTGRPKWHYVPVPNTPAVYCADHPAKPEWGHPIETRSGNVQMWKYKTARFMPRWASRITLELTDVRVARVQEISEEDARAEGVQPCNAGVDESGPVKTYRTGFVRIWQEINASRGYDWQANPWVWALTFRRVEVRP
jgi:hypothetical protein